MINTNRLDSIVFDLKQSIEDLNNELKLMVKEINELNIKIEILEKKK